MSTRPKTAGEDPKLLPPTQIGRALQELDIRSPALFLPQLPNRPRSSSEGTRAAPPGEGSAGGRSTTINRPTPTWKASFCPGGTPRCGCSRARPRRGASRAISALSHVETSNDCRCSYQIDRKAIVPGLRNSRVRRLEASRALRTRARPRQPLRRAAATDRSARSPRAPRRNPLRQRPRRPKAGEAATSRGPPVWQASETPGVAAKPRLYAELAVAAKARRLCPGKRRQTTDAL